VPGGYDFDYMGSDAILRKLQVVDGEWVVFDEHDPKRIAARWKALAMPRSRAHPPARAQAARRTRAGRRPGHRRRARGRGRAGAGRHPAAGRRDQLPAALESMSRTGPTPASWCSATKPAAPAVVAASAPPGDLGFVLRRRQPAHGESAKAGTYAITLSDGSRRNIVSSGSGTFAIAGPWKATPRDGRASRLCRKRRFDLPAGFGAGQRVTLDLGAVSVMAKVKLNDQVFDTLWMPPFTLDVTEALKPGANNLQVLVTSTTEGQALRSAKT
jgi:hypothetical protein